MAFSFSTPATSSNAATTQPLAAFSFANNKGMVYSHNKSFNNIYIIIHSVFPWFRDCILNRYLYKFARVFTVLLSWWTVPVIVGPDMLDLLDLQTYFFNFLGSGAKRPLQIFTARILATDLSDATSSNLAFLLFIRYVKS